LNARRYAAIRLDLSSSFSKPKTINRPALIVLEK
jgi:hypothetical protein